VIRLNGLALAPPQLPRRGIGAASWQVVTSAALHAAVIATLAVLAAARPARRAADVFSPAHLTLPDQTTRMIFLARGETSGGGGGGGNRQPGPIRQAEGIGRDRVTVPVRRAASPAPPEVLVSSASAPALDSPGLLLDARPLASGTREIAGLLEGGVAGATSLGPGTGGGVGDGTGTGIGPGEGPGIGPGSGGGIGGGIYRAGGSVTSPRLLVQVRPSYTDDALLRKIQGTVELELVVTKTGRPANIRVRRSLDPGGLDERAIAAVEGWRFEPGRLLRRPVDVMVTVLLDFRIQ